MSTRRGRLNLSLVRRSESPKSPIGDRTRSSISEFNTSTDSGCSTPLNTRKRSSTYSDGSPVAYDNDSPAVPMSQDTSNLISGVAWAWNSPKRAIVNEYRQRPRPLLNNNIISNKDPDFSRAHRKKATERLTGFYKFQSDLKLLQESEESQDSEFDLEKKESCTSIKVHPPTSPPPSPGSENVFISFCCPKDPEEQTPVKPRRSGHSHLLKSDSQRVQSDSFNDSELDYLLLKASQAVEKNVELVDILDSPDKWSKAAKEKQPEKRRSFFKRHTTDNFDSASDGLLDDSDLDAFLIEATQMVESANTGNVPSNGDKNMKETTSFSSRKSGGLTRHKSMPESPSQKLTGSSRIISTKWSSKRLPQSPISVTSSSNASSVLFVRPKHDVIVVSSSDSASTISSHTSSLPAQPPRKCTKEEIEQKRQEALKRQQASRLKRLIPGNSSQSDPQVANTKYH